VNKVVIGAGLGNVKAVVVPPNFSPKACDQPIGKLVSEILGKPVPVTGARKGVIDKVQIGD